MHVLIAQSTSRAFAVIGPLLFLIPILALTAVVAWLIVKAVKHDRDLTHQERIRAIEHGMQPASLENEKKYQHNTYWISFWIGAGVPIAAVGSATRAMSHTELPTTLKAFLWGGVMMIAVAGVISAAALMRSARPRQETPTKAIPGSPPLPKGDNETQMRNE